MAFTTWSATDKTNMTLSGSNLIATIASNATAGVRAADAQITGLFYFEYTCTTFSNANSFVGLALGTTVLGSLTGSVGVQQGGSISVNGAGSGSTLGARANGDVIGVAINTTTNQIWLRVGAAGNWNGSATANPATGVGGISLAAITAGGFPLYPYFIGLTSGQAVTANFGATAFTGTVPAGFTSGFTSGAAPPSAMVGTQLGSEVWATGLPAMQVTQIGAEVFVAPNPDYQLTQLGLEVWAAGNPTYNLTQIGLEVWASVAPLRNADPLRSNVLAGSHGGRAVDITQAYITTHAVAQASDLTEGSLVQTLSGVGAASGSGVASGVGTAILASVASASGTGAASADTGAIGSGTGSSDGIGDAAAIGSATAESVGEADGVGAADGVAVAINSAVAASAGSGAASGVGRSTAAAVAVASGSGQSSADAQTLVSGSGFFHPVF